MLKETTLIELAKRSGCSVAELKRAIGTETEETLAFDTEGEFITHLELEAVKERAGKDSYKEGKTAGEEMFGKELKRLTGLEFEGRNAEKVISAIKLAALEEAKVEPTKRIQELESDNQKLKALVTETEAKLTDTEKQYMHKLTAIEIETLIKTTLPEKLANGLSREQAFKLFKADNDFTKTDQGLVIIDPVTREVRKDKKLNPVSITDSLKDFMAQFGEVNDGRGGGDNQPRKKSNIESFTKRSEVEKYFSENETPLSEQAGILQKAMKNEGFKVGE